MKGAYAIVLAALLAAAPPGAAPAQAESVPIPRPAPRAAAQTNKTQVKTPVASFCSPSRFRIAIDIGHTPKIPGSISARGVGEYAFNLRLAREIHDALREAGFSRAFLINPSGKEIRLYERVRAARRENADLFLSVHHDSVRRAHLLKWVHNGEDLDYTSVARGHSLHISLRGPKSRQSLAAARLLGNALREQGLTPTDHHMRRNVGANLKRIDAYAGVYNHPNLAVLWLSKMPSLLLEGSVIKNPKDETRADDPAYRKKLVAGVLAMAKGYCGEGTSLF